MTHIEELAALLDDAARDARPVAQIDPQGRLGLDEAYAIQKASIERRARRGAPRVGVKMGFTSRSKMLQMGLSDVIWGRLTRDMQVEEGGCIDLGDYIHPRVEPELAFILKRPVTAGMTAAQALACVEAIAPALEIIDSRYADFKFSLTDVIADNASSSGFVIGPWADPAQDFGNLGLALAMDGHVVQIGSTAAILGHPLRALVAAARLAAQAGEELRAGDVVMAGAATAAEWILPGQSISVEIQGLGQASFKAN
ncbi:2-keto-4-pentenoate hydratase [Variovorax sp. Root434]|uniref:2-keto-4-pentenoate hydratase n=1 Tax=Variovorax sp. Root434 TaxID=1736536 RepID=UPI0006FE4C1F|nr:fumarylacetoacetate hydrolase family protein [Variovorax sp. Root434]KQX26590.1 4-oxalocrotonate decarboxylase [Variovorax sp. Root434]